jgi:hypothetical protein
MTGTSTKVAVISEFYEPKRDFWGRNISIARNIWF